MKVKFKIYDTRKKAERFLGFYLIVNGEWSYISGMYDYEHETYYNNKRMKTKYESAN